MKRLLLRSAAAAALALTIAVVAHADGSLNMAWTDCVGDATPVTDMAFACATNSNAAASVHTLVLSFIAPAGLGALNSCEMYVDMISQASPLPDWWHSETGGCRANAIGVNFGNGSAGGCLDAYNNAGSGGVAGWNVPVSYLPTINSGNTAQYAVLDFIAAVPQGQEVATTAGLEYFCGNVVITNTKTTGVGSCAGCLGQPVCISFTRLNLTQPAVVAHDFFISTPGVNSLVTWQGVGADCNAVPVKKATWGAIKSMYR